MFKSSVLLARLTEIKNWAQALCSHFIGGTPHTQWMVPANADIMNPTLTGSVFTDNDLQAELTKGHEAQNPYLAVMQINMQINALASLERSFRSRHMSPVRALYSTAGRHLGQAEIINESIS